MAREAGSIIAEMREAASAVDKLRVGAIVCIRIEAARARCLAAKGRPYRVCQGKAF